MPITLTREQVRRVDRLAVERYGMSGLVLMENAGRNAARIIQDHYESVSQTFICCGTGNNGGDGSVIARHLHNAGWSVRLLMVGDLLRLTPDASANLNIVRRMGISIVDVTEAAGIQDDFNNLKSGGVIIDALLGTGFHGQVRQPAAAVIDAINDAHVTRKQSVVAIDVPSGLDCNTGTPSHSTVQADLTITFVARKTGFDAPSAAPFLGHLEIADIGAPRELIDEVLSGSA